MKFPRRNPPTRPVRRPITHYLLFTATAILVLITAHAKSAGTGAPVDTTLRQAASSHGGDSAAQDASNELPLQIPYPADGQDAMPPSSMTGNNHHQPEDEDNDRRKLMHKEKTHQHHNKQQPPPHQTTKHHHQQPQPQHKAQHEETQTPVAHRSYHSKYTIEELLHTKFPRKMSNDIDMDPCKAGGFMGDIALPDMEDGEPIVARTIEWEMPQADQPLAAEGAPTSARSGSAPVKFNATLQQELEILKQEVYHEGLQVEEEGLTDIIRKKTKLPASLKATAAVDSSRNEAIVSANELVKPTAGYSHQPDYLLKATKNEVTSGSADFFDPRLAVNTKTLVGRSSAVVSEGDDRDSPLGLLQQRPDAEGINEKEVSKQEVGEDKAKAVKASSPEPATDGAEKSTTGSWSNRHVDQRKIQSNTKDIEDDSGNNFVADRKVVILTPTTLPAPQQLRSTLPNVYSNAGGNGMKQDDVEVLHAEGVVRRRHRRGRKNRRSSETRADYAEKLRRLRDELNRPVRTQPEDRERDAFGRKGRGRQELQQSRRQQVTTADLHKLHHQPDPAMEQTEYDHREHKVAHPTDGHQHQHYHQQHKHHSRHHPRSVYGDVVVGSDKSFNYSVEMLLAEREQPDTAVDKSSGMKARNAQDPAEDEGTERRHRMTRAVTAKKDRVWDYGVIPYEIDGNFSGLHKALFKQAMRHWENSTCIKFVERDPEIHPNYIVFTIRSCGCCSFVGKRGNGPQAISIGRNCDKFGIVVHELGHVVGFWHEHTRPDREKHVVIEHNNIMKGQDYNFNKLTPDEVDSLGMAYDYDSIMHYARNTFSKGTYLDTILPIEVKGKKRPEIGQRLRLSAGDIAQANLLYKCPKCGRTFQENTGLFASPSYYTGGAVSNETEHCEWRITATHGERVELRLQNLNIFKSNNCQTDYLEVRDGYYFKSPLIGRYCGKVSNEILKSESSRMLLTYVNTHRPEGYHGFMAEFDVICGGELTVDDGEGRLESPNYPLEYLPNKECVWKITVPKGYQVALKFQSFEVENHDSCVYDSVEVRDGPSKDSLLIGVFCGYKSPPNMKSTGNTMYVRFTSDSSVQKAGFSAIFMKEVDECETQNHGCEHDCINTLGGYECSCHIGYELHSDKRHCEDACGGVIEYPNGTITSPSFPDPYPVLKDCIWEIIAQPKHKISLNFTHFDLEGTIHQQSDCGYDSVTIFSKLSENRLKRIGTYCGRSLPPTVTSESNALRVEFHSDKSIQSSGFAAVFFTDIDECAINNGGCQHECRNTIGSYMCLCHNGYSLHENGLDCKEGECKHEISGYFGTIYSPNYPDLYPPNADCVWHFSTTPGHRIKLIFNEFNVESHQECAYDNVAIYDGDSEASSILGRFCGDKIPYPISSSTNQLYMVLKTDKNKQLNGFTAVHSTSCGGYLRATNQIQQFYSHAHFGHNNYNDNMDCEWTIQAPSNSNVQLLFLTFDIEPSENCTYDYVQVYSGMEDTSGPMYGQYCGNTLPQDIISLTDSLLVRFKTDNSIFMKGFSASYVAVHPFSTEDQNSYSSEMVTPFPGSLKSIYEKESPETEDYSDFNENQVIMHNAYRQRNKYQNRF